MSPEVRDALESACSQRSTELSLGRRPRHISLQFVRAVVNAVLTDLPGEMTVEQLREETSINSAQWSTP